MKKGDKYIGTVEEVDFPAKGIVCIEGEDKPVIVKNVIPGQKISLAVSKVRGGRAEGRLLEVLQPAASETEKPCPHFGSCGGCVFQTMGYESQLAMKEAQVKKILDAAIKGNYVYEGIQASPLPVAYRNKMEYTFGDTVKNGSLSLGLHRRGSMYDIVTTDRCSLTDDDFDLILHCVHAHFLAESNAGRVAYYHKGSHLGYLRHLLVRKAAKTGEILVDLVTTTQLVYDLTALADKLKSLELSGHIVGFLHTYNDNVADVIHNERTEIVFGQDYFYEELLGLRFKITPFSFFQTNSLGAEVLYQKVREYIGETKDKVVFDLYSGTGTIAQLMAPVARKVIGVEIVEEAVASAIQNAAMNGLCNCTFLSGDVLKVLDILSDAADNRPDIIILDPPRDGVHPKALPKIGALIRAPRMIYISCKPTSLARDLEKLQEYGYVVERACCVDMFPGTGNVETVVLLSQRKPDDRIEVEIELDELDLTSAESKATYAEIKDYVLKEYGLKVSNLYISQVKRKCGIDVGENYNLPKSEGARGPVDLCSARTGAVAETVRQPQCPVEKEKAIKDALEHFGMV